jgi:hypothetical protein
MKVPGAGKALLTNRNKKTASALAGTNAVFALQIRKGVYFLLCVN